MMGGLRTVLLLIVMSGCSVSQTQKSGDIGETCSKWKTTVLVEWISDERSFKDVKDEYMNKGICTKYFLTLLKSESEKGHTIYGFGSLNASQLGGGGYVVFDGDNQLWGFYTFVH